MSRTFRHKLCILVSVLSLMVFSLQASAEKNTEIGQLPAMGWNSWNTFDCDVDEQMIREMADAMVESGMKDAGYEYINIDDCWHGERDQDGNIQVSKEHFPSGMKALAEYVHAKGLKLGIYSDAGNTTCAGRPGSRGHEYQDAKTYADWGIDYLKYDWCDTDKLNPEGAYTTMRDALHATGRPILYSICEWGDNQPWEWATDIGHSWRISGDIYPCWDCGYSWGSWSSWGVLKILDMRKDLNLRQYAKRGQWNDMDMMEVGNGMTAAEDRSHFSLWAMLNSPLIAGNDLRTMSKQTLDILTNKDIIALNQDAAGVQAMRYIDAGDLNVFVKPLMSGDWAFLFLNRGDDILTVNHDWQFNVVKDDLTGRSIDFNKQAFDYKGLWKSFSGDTSKPLQLNIPAHDVVVLRLTPKG